MFDLDPEVCGSTAYTPHQFLYVGHDDFRLMNIDPEEGRRLGRLKIRRSAQGTDPLSIVSFFRWEYPTSQGWRAVAVDRESQEGRSWPPSSSSGPMPACWT